MLQRLITPGLEEKPALSIVQAFHFIFRFTFTGSLCPDVTISPHIQDMELNYHKKNELGIRTADKDI